MGHTYPYEKFPLLDDVSFCVNAGETVTLLCSVQSGKSTVGKLAIGYLKPTTGSILYKGCEISGIKGEKNLLYLPQSPLLFDKKTVLYNLMQPILLRRGAKDEAKAAALRSAKQYSLNPMQKVGALTSKDRLKVFFARANQRRIELAVIDDCDGGAQQEILEYCTKRGAAVLLLVSNPSRATGRVVIIDDKKTVFEGDSIGAKKYTDSVYWVESIQDEGE